MPNFSPSLSAFNGGEVSPLFDARGDVERYNSSLSLCENFIPTPQGPITKRPGTIMCGGAHDDGYSPTLYPFQYSASEGYALEMAVDRIRFWRDGSLVCDPPVAVTSLNGAIATAAGHGCSAGDQVRLSGATVAKGYLTQVFDVASVSGDDVTLADTSAFAGVTRIERVYALKHTFEVGDVPYVDMYQSADVLFAAHGNYWPKVISRYGENNWTVVDYDFIDGPYEDINTSDAKITPSATDGSITLTLDKTDGVNEDQGFASTDVRRLIRLKDPVTNNWTWAEITVVSSRTVATANIRGINLSNTDPIEVFRLGLWSATTGFPTCVSMYQDRLVWGGGTSTPHAVCFSESGDYYSHRPAEIDGTVKDSNAINISVTGKNTDSLLWMVADQNGLVVGSASEEKVIHESTSAEPLAPTNVRAVDVTQHGGTLIKPISAAGSILFYQRGRTALREISYVAESGGYRTQNLTSIAGHMTQGGAIDATFEEIPYPVVWTVRADGMLVGFSYDKEANVVAWHRHPMENGFVEKVVNVPTSSERQSDTYLVIRREINGQTKRFIEVLDQPWGFNSNVETCNFLDASILHDGRSVNSIDGLWWLEGETVSVMLNGSRDADLVVTNGSVQLSRNASRVRLGKKITSKARTMHLLGGSAEGTGRGKIKKIIDVVFHLWDSWGGKAGHPDGEKDAITQLKFGAQYNTAPELVTGETKVSWPDGYEPSGRIYFEHDDPYPFTLLGLFPRVEVEDGG